jgi:hypothetical protein
VCIFEACDEVVAEVDALEIILHVGWGTIVAMRLVIAVMFLLRRSS